MFILTRMIIFFNINQLQPYVMVGLFLKATRIRYGGRFIVNDTLIFMDKYTNKMYMTRISNLHNGFNEWVKHKIRFK